MDYEKQGLTFLEETKTEFKAEFLKHGKHFNDDKERDIYEITLKRGNRVYKFEFGQSIANSGAYIRFWQGKKETSQKYKYQFEKNKDFKEPTAYDVLTCLTKNEVGTFEDFCGDFGYEVDSIKAEKIYKAVVNEWQNIKMLYTDKEIEKLQEIQ